MPYCIEQVIPYKVHTNVAVQLLLDVLFPCIWVPGSRPDFGVFATSLTYGRGRKPGSGMGKLALWETKVPRLTDSQWYSGGVFYGLQELEETQIGTRYHLFTFFVILADILNIPTISVPLRRFQG